MFSHNSLQNNDPEIYAAISQELNRQQCTIELIASENIVSLAVLEAQGSVLTNKYAEGYPGRRYYGGCEYVDKVESLALERVRRLFSCQYANVQPHSGSQANQAVFLALLKPGDKILSMSLGSGGHLTHGSKVNQSGKWFDIAHYEVDQSGLIDYEAMRQIAIMEKPKLIIAGGSAYPRFIDFPYFRAVADHVGAHLMVDMAHFAGLVAAGLFPSPLPHAHVVTSTTHKTLRGPRGGIILSNDLALGKKFDSAVFPGMQGGPLMHVIAAKAVAFGEALKPEFIAYMKSVAEGASAMAAELQRRGHSLSGGGTDSHLLLLDLRPLGLTGAEADHALEQAGLTCNKNSLPFDTQKPNVTSGIRLGSPAGASRGFGKEEFTNVAVWVDTILQTMATNPEVLPSVTEQIRAEVHLLCQRFPIYSSSFK